MDEKVEDQHFMDLALAQAALATHAGDEAFEQLEYQKQRLDSELG